MLQSIFLNPFSFFEVTVKKKKSSQIVNYIQSFQGNRLLNVFIYTRDEYKGVHLHLHKTFLNYSFLISDGFINMYFDFV